MKKSNLWVGYLQIVVMFFFVIFSTSSLAYEVCSGGQQNINVSNLYGMTCNGQSVFPLLPINKAKIESSLESRLNNLLEVYGIAKLSYDISKSIINGDKALKVAGQLLDKFPKSGLVTSIPGLFEMNIRVVNGQLVWIVEGSLLKYIPRIGFVQTSPDQSL